MSFCVDGAHIQTKVTTAKGYSQTGGEPTHQHPGSTGSHQNDRISRPQQPTHLPAHRQRGGKICHKQTQVEGISTLPLPNHAMSSSQIPQPQHHCLQDSVLPEPDIGCSQQGPPSHDRMVPPSGNFQQNHGMERPGERRPNGNSSQQEDRSICLPLATSSGCSHRCKDSGLEQMKTGVATSSPPKKFITQLLPKLQSYKFHGVFIAPWQPTAPCFPPLF